MADTIRNLFSGVMPTADTTVYTVPSSKYAIVKCLTMSNNSATPQTINVTIGGIRLAINYVVPAKDTLIINDIDIPMVNGETIQIRSTEAGSNTSMSLVGFERDYVASEYPYVKLNGTVQATATTLFTASGGDWILKRAIFTSMTGNKLSFYTSISYASFIDYTLSPYDTLYVPLQRLVSNGTNILGTAVGYNNSLVYGLVLEKVVT